MASIELIKQSALLLTTALIMAFWLPSHGCGKNMVKSIYITTCIHIITVAT